MEHNEQNNPNYYKLLAIKDQDYDRSKPNWRDYHIQAVLTQDINYGNITYKSGDTVKVNMVSGLGDVGITDNLLSACGYNVRIDPDEYLTDIVITLK